MGWGKALSAVIVMSISVMLVVSVLPVGAASKDSHSPLMMAPNGCNESKCPVYVDTNKNGYCDSGDKIIMLPAKVAKSLKECIYL